MLLRYFLVVLVCCQFTMVYAIHSKPLPAQKEDHLELRNQSPTVQLSHNNRSVVKNKPSLKEKVFLKIFQKKLNKNASTEKKLILDPIGFFLGLFLLPVGVLLTYIFVKKNKNQARKSAWIGFLSMVALFVIVSVLVSFFINALLL